MVRPTDKPTYQKLIKNFSAWKSDITCWEIVQMYGQMWNQEQVMRMTVDIPPNPIILLIRRKHLYKLPIFNKFKILLNEKIFAYKLSEYEVYQS